MDRKLLVIPLTVVIAGAAIGGLWWHSKRVLRTEAGRPRSGFIVHTSATTLLVLVDRVRTGTGSRSGLASGTRITTLDATTGHQVALRVLDDDATSCWPAVVGRLWCNDRDGFEVLDATTLNTIATSKDLLAKANVPAPVRDHWRADHDSVILELPDGRGTGIDSSSLAVTVADAKGITGPTPPVFECTTRSDHKLDTDYLMFGEGPRHPLLRAPTNYQKLPPAPASAPTFLRQDMQPYFLVLPDPSLLLVLSVSSLDQKAAVELISRVDTTPALTWTTELGGSCQYAQTIGGTLVVATTTPAARARAFDLATGKILWTFAFAN